MLNRKIESRLGCFALGLAAAHAFAGKDTPEGMMSIAKQEGVVSVADMQTAASDINAFYTRVATDKAYAGKLLDAIQKSDKAGIITALQSVMTKSTVTVGKINPDFHVDISITVGKSRFSYCFSSDHSCDGHNVTLG